MLITLFPKSFINNSLAGVITTYHLQSQCNFPDFSSILLCPSSLSSYIISTQDHFQASSFIDSFIHAHFQLPNYDLKAEQFSCHLSSVEMETDLFFAFRLSFCNCGDYPYALMHDEQYFTMLYCLISPLNFFS